MPRSKPAPRVALCSNIEPVAAPDELRGRNHAIIERLVADGHEVDVLHGPENLTAPLLSSYDAGMLCPNDLVAPVPDPDGRLAANTVALALEAADVPFVNSPLRRVYCTNKLLTHMQFAKARLPHPETWTMAQLTTLSWPPRGMIIKPVTGSCGLGVALVQSASAALAHAAALREPCLMQEYIPNARCIRVVATRDRSVGRYEKLVSEGVLVAAVTSGAEEVPLPPDDQLDDLAIQAVRAVDIDIGGVDILETNGQLYALEVNVNFGFYPRNTEILDALSQQVRYARLRIVGGQQPLL